MSTVIEIKDIAMQHDSDSEDEKAQVELIKKAVSNAGLDKISKAFLQKSKNARQLEQYMRADKRLWLQYVNYLDVLEMQETSQKAKNTENICEKYKKRWYAMDKDRTINIQTKLYLNNDDIFLMTIQLRGDASWDQVKYADVTITESGEMICELSYNADDQIDENNRQEAIPVDPEDCVMEYNWINQKKLMSQFILYRRNKIRKNKDKLAERIRNQLGAYELPDELEKNWGNEDTVDEEDQE